MGHLGRIASMNDLPTDAVLKKYIKAAMKLNEHDIKLPARSKATEAEKKKLEVPDYLTRELKKNKTARELFEGFSYSHKKEYIEWFEDAKTDATRNKRMSQAMEWITEGKSRNWKYMNC